MISIETKSKGDKDTERFLRKLQRKDPFRNLPKYAEMGVNALKAATPVKTGKTRDSWGFKIEHMRDISIVYWTNNNFADGIPVVILLNYGHVTKDGGYFAGLNMIEPAMLTVYKEIADGVWKEVINK